jgi:glycosyltransferase involved in cell wall biosynthesis
LAKPTLSVIIPTYGRPRFLNEAISSVLAQTVADFECIVVDDGSAAPVAVALDRRVRVVHRDENGGPAAARNTGLEHAQGRYVTFLDDDDLYTPDRLALGLEGVARAPVSICWRRGSDGSYGGNRVLEGHVYDSILDHLTPHLGQVTIDRTIAPTFDERFVASQDVEWWLRVTRVAKVSTISRVGHIYRTHSGPRNRNGLAARVGSSLLLLSTHGDYFASHPRAAAFRWKRIGLMANRLGDYSMARSAFQRSLRVRPELATLWHLARSLRKSTADALDNSTPFQEVVR